MELFYYSGTGFTLAAAETFASHFGSEVRMRPIIQLMHKGVTSTDAQTVGLFMPMHSFGLPLVFRQFLKDFRFPGASYIFALVTRGGAPTNMHREINRLLTNRENRSLDAFQYVTTPNTFNIIFRVPEDPTVIESRKRAALDIETFAAQVKNREIGINRGYRNRFHESFTFPLMKWINRNTGYFNLQNSFFADDQCTGCGQCEKTCLSGKIHIEDNHPAWKESISCHYCLTCLHLCPAQAVQVRKSKTPELERVYHPQVDWKAIASQK